MMPTVTKKAQDTIHIRWVRSGIGFDRRQKRMIRSLGLRRLGQVVERPDTAQIRGLVARLPHFVEVVDTPSKPWWSSVPEHTILPPEAVPAILTPVEPPRETQAPGVDPEAQAEEVPAQELEAHAEKLLAATRHAAKGGKIAKAVAQGKVKHAKAAENKKTKAVVKTKSDKKRKK
jgi:large subunit ribosomal protein L30